jgi:hypothetical protein
VDTSRNLMTAVLAGIAAPIVFQSIALLLIGIIMLLAARIKRKVKPTPQPQDTEGEVPDEKSGA